MNEVFITRRAHLRVGLISLAFFSSMVVLSVLAAYDSPVNRKIPVALSVGGFWSCWAGLSVWVVLAYFKESVTLGDADVHFTHVFGERTIVLVEILRGSWRLRYSRLSLKLFLRDGKEVLQFENFRPDQQRRLIDYFHERVSLQVQEGWSEEVQRYASEVEVQERQSVAELDKFLWSLWRPALFAGSIGVFSGGLLLYLWALKWGVVGFLPSWSGSFLLDWFGKGILVGLVVLIILWMLHWAINWIYKPEEEKGIGAPRRLGFRQTQRVHDDTN